MGKGGAFKEYYVYSFEDLALPASTGIAFDDITVKMDSDADFEIIKRSFIATDPRIRVRYQDDSYGRQFQNASLDIRAVSGTILAVPATTVGVSVNNFIPYILPRPYLIRAGTTFTNSYADFSVVGNVIRESFHGAKLRPGQAPWDQEWNAKPPFTYTTGLVTLTAGNTFSGQIPIQVDSHFLITKITGTRSSTAPALVTIKTGGNDRQWMDKAVHFDNLVGNAQFPNILPAPRLAERGSNINVTIQNLSGVTGTYEIIFGGMKLF